MTTAIDGMGEIDPDGVFVAQGTVLRKRLLSPLRTGDIDLPTVVPLGWQTNSPLHRSLRADLGIDDIYTAIAEDAGVYLAANPTVDPALFATFMEEHRGRRGRLRPVARIDTVIVYDALVDLVIIDGGAVEVIGPSQRILADAEPDAVLGELEIGPGRRQRGRVRGWVAAPQAAIGYVVIITGDRVQAIVLPSEPRPEKAAAAGVAPDTPLGFYYDFDGPVPADLQVAVVVGDSVRVLD